MDRNRLAQEMWEHVSAHEANSGLWHGEPPLFGPTQKLYQKLLTDGKIERAMDLQAAPTLNISCATRTSSDPLQHICPRYGAEAETLVHRLWTCPNNSLCSHPDVVRT